MPRRFSAVFCSNNQTLWGAGLALHRRRLRVPDDISMVGFDDLPQSWAHDVSRNHSQAHNYEMGQAALNALLRARRSVRYGCPEDPSC